MFYSISNLEHEKPDIFFSIFDFVSHFGQIMATAGRRAPSHRLSGWRGRVFEQELRVKCRSVQMSQMDLPDLLPIKSI